MVYVEQRVIGVVVQIRVLRKPDAHERVGPDRHLAVQAQLALNIAIEGRSSQADHNNHYADVNDVAAVAARIAARQEPHGHKKVATSLP